MDIKNLTYMKILAIAYRLMYFLGRDSFKKIRITRKYKDDKLS